MGILLTAGSAISFNSLILDRSDETVDDISVTLSWEDAQTEATKRGLTLLPPMPEGAGRGWLSTQKRQNPEAITVRELEEIIKKEKFAERYKHIKKKQRVR